MKKILSTVGAEVTRRTIFIACIAFLSTLNPQPSTGQTIPQTELALKSYFITGAVPTSTNYFELIGTMFWYFNATYTNAQAASSNAANAAAWNPTRSTLRVRLSDSVPYVVSDHTNNANITFGTTGSGVTRHWLVTNTFTFTLPDTNYLVTLADCSAGSGKSPGDYWGSKNSWTNYCTINITNNGYTLPAFFYFQIYE
jgi:hypothetical protein